jgi:hypothetical protein
VGVPTQCGESGAGYLNLGNLTAFNSHTLREGLIPLRGAPPNSRPTCVVGAHERLTLASRDKKKMVRDYRTAEWTLESCVARWSRLSKCIYRSQD